MALLIGEVDVLEADVAVHIRIRGAGAILLGLGVDHVGQAVQGHAGLGHLREHTAQTADGEGQYGVVGDEGDVFAGGHLAPDDEHRAEDRHQKDLEAAEDVLDGEKLADNVAHMDPAAGVVFIDLLKVLPLPALAGEGAHHPHAGQVLLDDVGDLALLLVAAAEALVHLLAEDDGVGQDDGDGHGGDDGHFHVHGEHEVEGHGHQDQDAEHRRQLLGHEGAHAVHVGGAALDDVAGAVFHVPGVGQPGDVGEEGVPHVLHQDLGAPGVQHGGAELGGHPHNAQTGDGQGRDPQVLPDVGKAAQTIHDVVDPEGEVRWLAAHGVVDGAADDLGVQHIHQGGQCRAQDAQREEQLAAPQKAEKEPGVAAARFRFAGFSVHKLFYPKLCFS